MLKRFLQSLNQATSRPSRRKVQQRRQRCNARGEVLEQRALLTTLTVTTRFDLVDPNDGLLSLREALAAAADEGTNPGHDTITFDADLGAGVIHADYSRFDPDVDQSGNPILTPVYAAHGGGQFVVDSDVTIDGTPLGLARIGHERGWAERHRIFQVNAGVAATFRNIVVQGGDSSDEDGGGIWNAGDLTLQNVVVGSNYALTSGFGVRGGGIFNSATGRLTLQNTHIGEVALTTDFLTGLGFAGDYFASDEASEVQRYSAAIYRGEAVVAKATEDPTQISGNGAYGNGGGIYNAGHLEVLEGSVIRGNRVHDGLQGAGVFNAGTMVVRDSTIEDQTRFSADLLSGGTGGGIYNDGVLLVERSTFRNNETNRQGGAIYNAGHLTVVDTTFDGNLAIKNPIQTGLPDPEGGAIYDAGIQTEIRRSTFSRGEAGLGGALFVLSNPDVELNQVTIAENTATTGGGIAIDGGVVDIIHSTIAWNTATAEGGGVWNDSSLKMRNSIVGENSAANVASGHNVYNAKTILSSGYNLLESLTGNGFVNGPQPSDLLDVDPGLGSLGALGGTTETVGLRPSSPAIDSGTGSDFARHVYRLQGSLNDENQGAALVSQGGMVTADGYVFEAGQGLTFTTDDTFSDHYAIELSFRLDSLAPSYKKVLDFKDRSSDNGLYIWEGRLYFYDEVVSPTELISAGTDHYLVLTRNRITSEVVVWVDGVRALSFFDFLDKAVFDAANGSVQLFRDDLTTGDMENASGVLTQMRFYDRVLGDAEVVALAADPGVFDARASADQRNAAGRIGRGVDRGAFESVPPVSMRVDVIDDINDGLYGEGELSLREAIEWANQIPGPDEIAFSADAAAALDDAPSTMALHLGQLTITDDLSIYGPGADVFTIDGQGTSRIFAVAGGVTADISGLTLASGYGIDRGGAILNEGTLELSAVRVTGSEVVTGPEGRGYGGGIANYGTLFVDASTIDNNSGPGNGGGIFNAGDVAITNSTISGNTSGFGGGLHMFSGTGFVESTTITRNHATSRGGGYRRWAAATLTLHNSIVAANTSPDGPDGKSETSGVLAGNYNVIGVDDQSGFQDGVNNNSVGTAATPLDPLLGRLRNLGGPTPVHGILPGSPALEAADPASFPRVDQRGVARPVDVLPDIGAFEYIAPTLTNPVTVDTLDGESDGAFGPGEMSLTEAILFTNDDPSLTSIVFDSALFASGELQTIQLVDTELDIYGDVVINGPGADLLEIRSAGNGWGVFEIYSFARIRDVMISGGDIYSGTRTFGAGIDNNGYTILESVYLTDHRAQYGGAIYNDRFATLFVNDSTIADSEAFWGGGLLNNGQATLTNVTVSGNSNIDRTWSRGGGIYSDNSRPDIGGSSLTLIHTTVTGNTGVTGGGIYSDGNSFLTLGNTLIVGNSASSESPDLHDDNSSLTSLGGNILGNNDGLQGTLDATDQFGTSAVPLTVPLTGLVMIGDAAMPMHGLLPDPGGNPAIDRGVGANGVGSDQRGVSRPFDGGYDIGAFEIGAEDALEFDFDNEIIVDSLSEVMDAYYGPGSVTLREAILLTSVFDANSPTIIDGVAYDRIRFAASLFDDADTNPAEIVLTRGELNLYGNVIIETTSPVAGPGVTLPRVTIDAGQASRVMWMRSGVSARLSDLNITGGVAAGQAQSNKPGGGIRTDGDLWLTRVDVYGNSAEYAGGGVHAGSGDVWMKDVVIRDNSAAYGGGISVEGGNDLTLIRSSVRDNSVSHRGGGISNIGGLTMIDSAVHGNSADDTGGGISTYYRDGLIRNSTISGNMAEFGAGIFRSYGGTLQIENSTIAANAASGHAGGVRNNGSVAFANTILATNTAPSGPDALNTGTFTSLGHNIFGSTSQFTNGGGTFSPASGDQTGVDPELGELGDNGGPTLTHLLKATSPAIDAGAAAFTPLMDQRGFAITDIPGTGSGIPDIGAYELQSVTSSGWDYQSLGNSQFGPGEALTYGFGFDDGKSNSKVRTDPYFLGFEFDTGPMTFGKIEDGPFGTKFGAELKADFSGKLGFEVGFYVNSGSVDVAYFGDVNYIVDPGDNGSAVVSAFVDVNDGGLFTVSPKIGAYADLVVELDADVSAQAALFGVVGADLIDIHVQNRTELFSLNRQMKDDGRAMFLTDSGDAVSRDPETGKFYDLSVEPQEIADPGLIIPLLDGDIRYFSLGAEDIVEGVVRAAKAAREAYKDVKAVRELNQANNEVTSAENERDRLNKQLEQAAEQDRRGASLKAQQEMTELAGPEYAAAVAQGKKGDELPEKQGRIRDAENDLVTAQRKKKKAESKVAKRAAKKLKSVSAGVVIDVGSASGSLLGAEVNVGIGASIGLASITKNIGSMQVTLPDVNLRDSAPDAMGHLSASTDDFVKNSEEDLKRQVAKAQIDLGAFIPGFPGGSYNVSLGPISLDVTTVSYNVGPQLNVTQDVDAVPVKVEDGLTYQFFRADGTTPESVQVTINGTPYAGGAFVHTVSFNEGDRIEVAGVDRDDNGQPDPVLVRPTMTIGSRFSNDIGLDIDLDGAFEAFGLSLSAFDQQLLELGPLLKHNHTLATFPLGDIFSKSFDLGTETVELAPFTLFNTMTRGRTAATAISTQPTATDNVSEATVSVPALVPFFLTTDQIDAVDDDIAYTVLDVEAVSGGTLASVEVLDERLSVSGGSDGSPFRISGYTADILNAQSSGLFAVRFDGDVADAVVQVTRSSPISLSDATPILGGNSALISQSDFERVGSRAVLNNDIDGDGRSLPETDGVLMIRYLAGFTGTALTNGAVGEHATRTDPAEVFTYISELLDQSLPPTLYPHTSSTLDFDGDGSRPTALGDGVLLARYLDGRRDAALVDGVVQPGAVRQTGAAVVDFIEVGRASATNPALADFGQVVDRTGADVFGLNGRRDADPNAVPGSSATAAQSGSLSSGSFGDGYSSGDSNLPSWEFQLDSYGQSLDFEELYIDSIDPQNLVSRIAVGSPTDFGSSQRQHLIDSGGSAVQLQKQTVSATLGVDEPLFIRAPDAGGYEYSASPGFQFTGFTIDPQIGGNLYQSAEFDLYLFDDGAGKWVFDRLITAADASLVLPNGDLQFAFAGDGVSAFRLYSLALPNRALHDEENSDLVSLEINTGVTLRAEQGATGTPAVMMTQLAERLPFGEPDVAEVDLPVLASDSGSVMTEFTVSRDGAVQRVVTTTTGLGEWSAPEEVLVGSSSGIELRGHDNVSDSAVLDLSEGPLRTEISFFGGFRTDTLRVLGADGVVDLVERDALNSTGSLTEARASNVQLSEVEFVDLRGTGDITLLVDADAVLENDPWHRQLFVRRDASDSVPLDGGWLATGDVYLGGVHYQHWMSGTANLFIESTGGGGDQFTNFAPERLESAGTTRSAGTTETPKLPRFPGLPDRAKSNSDNLFSERRSPDMSMGGLSAPGDEVSASGEGQQAATGSRLLLRQLGGTGDRTAVTDVGADVGSLESLDAVFTDLDDLLLGSALDS